MYQTLQQISAVFNNMFTTQNNPDTQIYIDNKCSATLSAPKTFRGKDATTLDIWANGKQIIHIAPNLLNDKNHDITVSEITYYEPPTDNEDMMNFKELGYANDYRKEREKVLEQYILRHNASENASYIIKNFAGDVGVLGGKIKDIIDDYLKTYEYVYQNDKAMFELANDYSPDMLSSIMELVRRHKEDLELAKENTPEGKAAKERLDNYNKILGMGDFVAHATSSMNDEEKKIDFIEQGEDSQMSAQEKWNKEHKVISGIGIGSDDKDDTGDLSFLDDDDETESEEDAIATINAIADSSNYDKNGNEVDEEEEIEETDESSEKKPQPKLGGEEKSLDDEFDDWENS